MEAMVHPDTRQRKQDAVSQQASIGSLCREQEFVEYPRDPSQLVSALRDQFLQTGHKLNGAIPSDRERDARIDQFVRESPVVAQATTMSADWGTFPEAAGRLLRCFERLCYRTKANIPDEDFRTSIYSYLVEQLARNTEFFGFNPSSLVTATLMSRESLSEIPGADLISESGELRKLFYRAFTANPQSIERFFSSGKDRLAELEVLLCESGTTMARSFQVLYAFFKPTRPVEELIKQHYALVDEMLSEGGFADLSRSLVESVVGRCKPQAVRGELERIVKETNDMLCDPEVRAVFEARVHHVRYVVSAHTDNPKEYLLIAAVQEARICALYGALEEEFNRKELRDLCIKNPTGAKSLEELLEGRLTRGGAEVAEDLSMPTWLL